MVLQASLAQEQEITLSILILVFFRQLQLVLPPATHTDRIGCLAQILLLLQIRERLQPFNLLLRQNQV